MNFRVVYGLALVILFYYFIPPLNFHLLHLQNQLIQNLSKIITLDEQPIYVYIVFGDTHCLSIYRGVRLLIRLS